MKSPGEAWPQHDGVVVVVADREVDENCRPDFSSRSECSHELAPRYFRRSAGWRLAPRHSAGVPEHFAEQLPARAGPVDACYSEAPHVVELHGVRPADDGVGEIDMCVERAEPFARDEKRAVVRLPRSDETVARGSELHLSRESQRGEGWGLVANQSRDCGFDVSRARRVTAGVGADCRVGHWLDQQFEAVAEAILKCKGNRRFGSLGRALEFDRIADFPPMDREQSRRFGLQHLRRDVERPAPADHEHEGYRSEGTHRILRSIIRNLVSAAEIPIVYLRPRRYAGRVYEVPQLDGCTASDGRHCLASAGPGKRTEGKAPEARRSAGGRAEDGRRAE